MEAWKRAYVLGRIQAALPWVAGLLGVAFVFVAATRYQPWSAARSARVLIRRELEPGTVLTAQTLGGGGRNLTELIEFRLQTRGDESWVGWAYGAGSSPSSLAPMRARIVAPCRLSISLPSGYIPKDSETRVRIGGEDWIVRFSTGRPQPPAGGGTSPDAAPTATAIRFARSALTSSATKASSPV